MQSNILAHGHDFQKYVFDLSWEMHLEIELKEALKKTIRQKCQQSSFGQFDREKEKKNVPMHKTLQKPAGQSWIDRWS